MKESKEDLKPDQKALEEDKTTNEDYLHCSLEQGCQRAHYLMLSRTLKAAKFFVFLMKNIKKIIFRKKSSKIQKFMNLMNFQAPYH